MRKLISSPATIVTSTDDGNDLYVYAASVWLTDEVDKPTSLEVHSSYSTVYVDVATTELDLIGLFKGVTDPSAYDITVRPVEEDDSTAMPGMPDFPLPVSVIGAIVQGNCMDAHVEALVGDDGFVNTLLLVTDVGMWVRYSSQWIRLWDVEPISNLNSVEVDDGAVDLYDSADHAGAMLPITSLPGPEKMAGLPGVPERVTVTVSPTATMTFTPETVTASMAHITIRIDSAEDLPGAIEVGKADPSVRWYIERRGRAFDPETTFPW